MPKISKSYVVFAIAFLVFSIPIFAFNNTTYANSRWETLKDTICGSSDGDYNATSNPQYQACIAGIGMTDTYCSTSLGPVSSEVISACKYGVEKSNINGIQYTNTGIDFIIFNCELIGGDDLVMARKLFKCEGDSQWQNGQGYCSIKYNTEGAPPKLTTPKEYECGENWRPEGSGEDEEPEEEDEDEEEETEDETPSGGSENTDSGSDSNDECGRGFTLGFLVCPLANWVTGLVDDLINIVIVPLLQWRMLI